MEPLDNPIWHALNTRHAHLAIGNGPVRRYPPAVTPFVAVDPASEDAYSAIQRVVPVGDKVGILSVIPSLPDTWELVSEIEIFQFVHDSRAASADTEARLLTPDDVPQMLELTALVYPAYFRPETAALGDYFGFFVDGKLAAMAGIRMALEGYQEISAVCTHPNHRGKGLAKRLVSHLANHIRSKGDTPFLHTESDNVAAQGIYKTTGFDRRAILPFHVYKRNQ